MLPHAAATLLLIIIFDIIDDITFLPLSLILDIIDY